MTDTIPGYAPTDPDTWPEEIAHLRDDFAGRLNVYRVMAHHPALLAAWEELRAHVVTRNALGSEAMEIAILRISHRLPSAYERAHHERRAAEAGISSGRIDATKGPPDTMLPEDRAVAQAVDELLVQTRLSPTAHAALKAHFGQAGVLDLMATVGFYVTLGAIANSFDIPLDPGVDPI